MPYIDPGAGTLLLQAVIAAVAGVAFTFRGWVRSTAQRLFGKRPPGP